jgi:L,D-transpeptidase ErfK/SrfK
MSHNKLAPASRRCLIGVALLQLALAGTAARAETLPLPLEDNDIVGAVAQVPARHQDTLLDIARRHGLGFEEIANANPTVNAWLPGEGTPVTLPKQHILPDAPREGIVINVPEMRLYYFPEARPGERGEVVTHPGSIGRMDWKTPLGKTSIVAKVENPAWYVPESIRAEHAARGDFLPPVVPPGPDNPLGQHSLRLGIPGYLIHGTNRPYGIGMRVTHGCMRLYPEDVESLFNRVPVGTPVRIIDQPYKAGWMDGILYLEAHPPLEESVAPNDLTPAVRAIIAATQERQAEVDWDKAMEVAELRRGIPTPIGVLRQAQPARHAASGTEGGLN